MIIIFSILFPWIWFIFKWWAILCWIPGMFEAAIPFWMSCAYFFYYKIAYRKMIVKDPTYWHYARKNISIFWSYYGKYLNGYDVVGLEKLPKSGPGVILFYHGSGIVEVIFFAAMIYLKTGRLIHLCQDRVINKYFPGVGILNEAAGVLGGYREECLQALHSNMLVGIAPGGVREAVFCESDTYQIHWPSKGFAKLVMEYSPNTDKPSLPIYPVFTRNSREQFVVMPFMKNFFSWIHKKIGIGIRPCWVTGLPIKMRTYVGGPLIFNQKYSIDEIHKQVISHMRSLIDKKQELPGNPIRSLLERLPSDVFLNKLEFLPKNWRSALPNEEAFSF